ncbi:MAG: glycosyltransferase family 2 protein [Anaerolineales bacterium]|nr:glycosyltransferase family 2 protein [Anaerolineales bacterium]
MRIGQNPAKAIRHVARPERVTVALLTAIPGSGGEQTSRQLAELRDCLASLWAHTEGPYDVLVFDNASCPEAKTYLEMAHRQGRIQYLVFSDKDVGRSGAWNFIFNAAPGEIIAYADSDLYFYPGWLSAQLAVLERFSQLGMVTGMPVRHSIPSPASDGFYAEQHAQWHWQRGAFLPWDEYWGYQRNLGVTEEHTRQSYADSEDLVLTADDEHFYAGAADFQFVAPKQALLKVLPFPTDCSPGQQWHLEMALAEQGYLCLSTAERWVRPLRNDRNDLVPVKTSKDQAPLAAQGQPFSFWKLKPVRALVRWVYHRTFELLHKR